MAKKKISPEYLAKLRVNIEIARSQITPEDYARGGEARKGLSPPNKGKRMSEEQRQKIITSWQNPERRQKARERFSGAGGTNWQGGKTNPAAAHLNTAHWREIRRQVYARDNYTCQDCGVATLCFRDSRKEPKRRVQCHHIIRRRDGGSDDLSNLVTLCMSCHSLREAKFKNALFA